MPKLFHWHEYKTETGKDALSGQIHIRDMPGIQKPFSDKLRTDAVRASRPLREALIDIAERQSVQRDLVAGPRLDPRKRHSVGVAMRRGYVDPYELRPYQRRSLTLDLPKIAIVSSCGVAEVNGDRNFLRRVCTLTLAVSWACETVGADVYGVMMEGHMPSALASSQPFRRAQLAYMLVEPGKRTNLQAYSVALDVYDFYGTAYRGAYYADPEAKRRMSNLQGATNLRWGATYPGWNGGYGVQWARAVLDVDIVIGIGKLLDLDDADISLRGRYDVIDAVQEIAKQAKALKGERR